MASMKIQFTIARDKHPKLSNLKLITNLNKLFEFLYLIVNNQLYKFKNSTTIDSNFKFSKLMKFKSQIECPIEMVHVESSNHKLKFPHQPI